MTNEKGTFPEVSRVGEYVAVLNFSIPTKEGSAVIFMACDGFSEFGFNICMEPNESADSVVKAVYLLTENKDFVRNMHEGFTLVFDRWEELSERLNAVVKPMNGNIIFDKAFHTHIAKPLVSTFSLFLQGVAKK